MTIDIDEIERCAKAATMGPWTVCQHLKSVEADAACRCGYRGVVFGPDVVTPMAICQPGHDPEPEGEDGLWPQNYPRAVQIANAQHIAAANPAAILALIAEVRALRVDADRYRRLRTFAHPSYNVKAMSNAGIASLAKEKFLTVHAGSWEAMDAVLDGVVTVNTVNVREQS